MFVGKMDGEIGRLVLNTYLLAVADVPYVNHFVREDVIVMVLLVSALAMVVGLALMDKRIIVAGIA